MGFLLRAMAIMTAYLTALGYIALGEYLFFFKIDSNLAVSQQLHLPLLGLLIACQVPPAAFLLLGFALVLAIFRHTDRIAAGSPATVVVVRNKPFRDDWLGASLQIILNRETRVALRGTARPAMLILVMLFFLVSLISAEKYADKMTQFAIQGQGFGFANNALVRDTLAFPQNPKDVKVIQEKHLSVLWDNDTEIDATPIHKQIGKTLDLEVYRIEKATGKVYIQHRVIYPGRKPETTKSDNSLILPIAIMLLSLGVGVGCIAISYLRTRNTAAEIRISGPVEDRIVMLPLRLAILFRDALLSQRSVLLRERIGLEVSETLYVLGEDSTLCLRTTENAIALPHWVVQVAKLFKKSSGTNIEEPSLDQAAPTT